MSIVFKTQQLIQEIELQFKKFKEAAKELKNLKANERMQKVDIIKLKHVRFIKNLISSLDYSINLNEENMDKTVLSKQREKLIAFKNKIEEQNKNLDYKRNENLAEKDIFEDRVDKKDRNNRGQLIKESDQAQKESEDKVKGALRMIYQMKEINDAVNVELERQINQLDSVYQELQQTQSNMNRAMKHISYFARSVYTDKLLMGLLVLIVLAVIAIIVLSSIGQIPTASEDTIE